MNYNMFMKQGHFEVFVGKDSSTENKVSFELIK